MVPLELPEDQVTSPLMSPTPKQPSPLPPVVIRQPKQQSPTVQSTSSSSQDMASPLPLSPDSTLSLYSRLNFSQARKQDYMPDPPTAADNQFVTPARNGRIIFAICCDNFSCLQKGPSLVVYLH